MGAKESRVKNCDANGLDSLSERARFHVCSKYPTAEAYVEAMKTNECSDEENTKRWSNTCVECEYMSKDRVGKTDMINLNDIGKDDLDIFKLDKQYYQMESLAKALDLKKRLPHNSNKKFTLLELTKCRLNSARPAIEARRRFERYATALETPCDKGMTSLNKKFMSSTDSDKHYESFIPLPSPPINNTTQNDTTPSKIQDDNKEEWLPVVSGDGRHEVRTLSDAERREKSIQHWPQVSNKGRYRDSNGMIWNSDGRGYWKIFERVYYPHAIVARAFLGAPYSWRDMPHHIDGDTSNNAVDNLQWVDAIHRLGEEVGRDIFQPSEVRIISIKEANRLLRERERLWDDTEVWRKITAAGKAEKAGKKTLVDYIFNEWILNNIENPPVDKTLWWGDFIRFLTKRIIEEAAACFDMVIGIDNSHLSSLEQKKIKMKRKVDLNNLWEAFTTYTGGPVRDLDCLGDVYESMREPLRNYKRELRVVVSKLLEGFGKDKNVNIHLAIECIDMLNEIVPFLIIMNPGEDTDEIIHLRDKLQETVSVDAVKKCMTMMSSEAVALAEERAATKDYSDFTMPTSSNPHGDDGDDSGKDDIANAKAANALAEAIAEDRVIFEPIKVHLIDQEEVTIHLIQENGNVAADEKIDRIRVKVLVEIMGFIYTLSGAFVFSMVHGLTGFAKSVGPPIVNLASSLGIIGVDLLYLTSSIMVQKLTRYGPKIALGLMFGVVQFSAQLLHTIITRAIAGRSGSRPPNGGPATFFGSRRRLRPHPIFKRLGLGAKWGPGHSGLYKGDPFRTFH